MEPVTTQIDVLLKIPKDAPLSWFLHSDSRQLITDKHISLTLQGLAKNVYNISSIDDLKLWTPHSIRVGACVALHEAGAETLLIKNQLRWRSDAFLTYLRHTPKVAHLHTHLIEHTKD